MFKVDMVENGYVVYNDGKLMKSYELQELLSSLNLEIVSNVVDVLKNADRIGADKDEPEGTRYIQISDTLATQMAESLQSLLQPNNAN